MLAIMSRRGDCGHNFSDPSAELVVLRGGHHNGFAEALKGGVMITVSVPAEQRLRLSDVPWETYVLFCDGLGERHIRVTYDCGEMEVMTVSSKHENNKKLLGRPVEALTEEMQIDIASSGQMTRRRKKLRKALEPDESYWIANE